MKIRMNCPVCGEITTRKIETGYVSGQDLGRPRGAKGCDTYSVSYLCPIHGVVTPIEERIPDPPIPMDQYGNPLDGEQWE